MVVQAKVDADIKWMSDILSILLRDLSIHATHNVAEYNKIFLPNAEYVKAQLRATRDLTKYSDEDYYRFLRLNAVKLAEMARCVLADKRKAADVMVALAGNVRNEKQWLPLQGYFREFFSGAQIISNARAA